MLHVAFSTISTHSCSFYHIRSIGEAITGNQAGNNIESHLNAVSKSEHMSESEEHSHMRICEGSRYMNMSHQRRKNDVYITKTEEIRIDKNTIPMFPETNATLIS